MGRYISRVTIAFDKEDKEYQLKAYDENGRRWEEADYFTSDRQDAIQTRIAMLDNISVAH